MSMINYPFPITAQANSEGKILFEDEIELPFSLIIEDLFIKITSTLNRSHRV